MCAGNRRDGMGEGSTTGIGSIPRKLEACVESGLLRNLHAVAVSRDGALVFEHYRTGPDGTIARDLGEVTFTPETLHDCRSVTKSVVSVLYGIALDRGLVPPPMYRSWRNSRNIRTS